MRLLKLITILLIAGQTYGQRGESKIKLADNVSLTLFRDTFDSKGKEIELSDKQYVISIDKRPVFGTDGEMPKTFLKKAILTIGTKKFELQVDGMYNPWFGDNVYEKKFKLKIEGLKYKVIAGFSDGAGGYGAEWIVIGQASMRTILTDDEKILFEYMEQ
jgi:hypothetical protein